MNLLIVAETNLDFEPEDVTAGIWGLLLFLALIGLLVFLFFSFAKHVRRAREPWAGEETGDAAEDAADSGTEGGPEDGENEPGDDSGPAAGHSTA